MKYSRDTHKYLQDIWLRRRGRFLGCNIAFVHSTTCFMQFVPIFGLELQRYTVTDHSRVGGICCLTSSEGTSIRFHDKGQVQKPLERIPLVFDHSRTESNEIMFKIEADVPR